MIVFGFAALLLVQDVPQVQVYTQPARIEDSDAEACANAGTQCQRGGLPAPAQAYRVKNRS